MRHHERPAADHTPRAPPPMPGDLLARSFVLSDEVRFPLTLTLTQCDVRRSADGRPSLFLAFFSPQGGGPTGGALWSERCAAFSALRG